MMPDPERVQALFLAAVECDDPEERAAVLDAQCFGDVDLRRRVEALLSAHDEFDESLDMPLAGLHSRMGPLSVTQHPNPEQPTGDTVAGATRDFDPAPGFLSDLTVAAGAAGASRDSAKRAAPAVAGYEVLGELGRGGMGVVYRARQVLLNRPCVLKMILAGVHANSESIVRFLAEAEAVARLQHPNIVQIHNVGQADGLPFFELEYVEGGSLDRHLDGTPWPARRAAELVEALARGVAEAHRQGIIHRDLKPGNVLLAADGTPKITDFGLAKALDKESGLTRTDSIMGSPGYMAPEQAAGQAKLVGPLADVYALGAILYELLTGGPPFRGTTVLEIIEQVKHAEPIPPSRLVPGLPRDIETIALKCLQKEPGKRYDSAAALAEDLRRFRAGELIVARPVPFWERAIKWARRRPAIATLAAAVLLLVAALLGLGVLSYERINSALRIAEERRKAAEESQREAIKQTKVAAANFVHARKAVDESFTIVSESKLLNVPGLRALRADLLSSSLRFYEEFLRERGHDPSLKNDLLRTRVRVADVLGELGRTTESNEAYEAAVASFEQALRDRPGDLDLKTGLADALHPGMLTSAQNYKLATLRRVVALREEVFEARHSDLRNKRDLALAYSRLYERLRGTRPGEALAVLERSVILRLEVAEAAPDDPDGIEGVFLSLLKVAWALKPSQPLALQQRALEVGREAVRLRPNDAHTAFNFKFVTQDTVSMLWELARKDEAIAELRQSVKILGELAHANADTPKSQGLYLEISRDLADRLAELNRPDEAVNALLESQTALDRLSRETAADIADSAGRRVAFAQRLGEIKPDLTPVQKARRDDILDRAVSDYRAAVAGGWNDLGVLKGATSMKDRPGYSALLTEAESAAKQPANSSVLGKGGVAPAVSRPKLDVKLDRAMSLAALGVARARSALVDESIATMDKVRALFDELARERPGASVVRKGRLDALVGFHVALQALALDRHWRGKVDESAAAQKKANEFYADLGRGRPDDPEVDAARRQALSKVADLRRETSRWGDTYRALRQSESGAREAARSAPAGRKPGQSTLTTLAEVGYGYGQLALWDEAAAAFGKAYEIDPVGLQAVEGPWDKGFGAWYRVAILQLQGGETEAYERLRQSLLRQCAAGNRASPVDQIRTATLRPGPRFDWTPILKLAEKEPEQSPWGQTLRGFALLRAGRDREALDAFQKAPDWINGWPARAIAHHRLGQTALAHEWLDRADHRLREDLDDALAGVGFTQSGWFCWWDDWLLRLIWTREAREFIDGKACPDATWMQQRRARALARINENVTLPSDPFTR
jgi:tetratricopeptide (TPR) repeat protein